MSNLYRHVVPFVLCTLGVAIQSCGGGTAQSQVETRVTSPSEQQVQPQTQIQASAQTQTQPTVQSQAQLSVQLQMDRQPVGVNFKTDTLRRVGGSGDNWCQTWASDGSVITAMDDGEWHTSEFKYHSRLYLSLIHI